MTEATINKCKLVAEALRKVMKMYRKAIEMKLEDQERLILIYFKSKGEKHEELAPIKEACESVLNLWKEGTYPHDSTLLDEVVKLLKAPYAGLFPKDFFDRDMLVYGWIDLVIQSLFDAIKELDLEKQEQHIVDHLWRSVHNTIVENPNFKGNSPYYKRRENYTDYGRAKNLWLEMLDKEFNSFIEYFEEN